jgi:hypothetical protein
MKVSVNKVILFEYRNWKMIKKEKLFQFTFIEVHIFFCSCSSSWEKQAKNGCFYFGKQNSKLIINQVFNRQKDSEDYVFLEITCFYHQGESKRKERKKINFF